MLEWAPVTLIDIINDKETTNLNPSHVKCILKQVLEGVKYLHENKVMHRDLKPHNIIVTSNGTVKLIDFNSAKNFGNPDVIMTK